jgi:hypothetical protein
MMQTTFRVLAVGTSSEFGLCPMGLFNAHHRGGCIYIYEGKQDVLIWGWSIRFVNNLISPKSVALK